MATYFVKLKIQKVMYLGSYNPNIYVEKNIREYSAKLFFTNQDKKHDGDVSCHIDRPERDVSGDMQPLS